MSKCVDSKTALLWAREAGMESAKGPTLFTKVTPEMVCALVNRAVVEALSEAQKVCAHYTSGEPDDMALQCQKHIEALKTKGLFCTPE